MFMNKCIKNNNSNNRKKNLLLFYNIMQNQYTTVSPAALSL